MNDHGYASGKSSELSLLVGRHFENTRISAVPVSIRTHVEAIKGETDCHAISDDDLVREVERCAVERGLCVCFDGRRAHADRLGSQ